MQSLGMPIPCRMFPTRRVARKTRLARRRSTAGASAAALLACAALVSAQSPGGRAGGPSPESSRGGPGGLAAASAPKEKDDALRILKIPSGETTASKEQPGTYERVLLTAPDDSAMASGVVREIGIDEAIRLARLPADERWRALRQTLGLAPDDTLVWQEMAEAFFVGIAELKTESRFRDNEFGLQIAFPGTDANAKPEAALTFGNATEDRIKDAVNDAATGIEALIDVTGADAAESAGVFRSLECQLLDRNRQPVAKAAIHDGYCGFAHVKVNPAFGRESYTIRLASIDPNVVIVEPQQAAYVLKDQRTRVSFTIDVPRTRAAAAGGSTSTATAASTPDPTTMIQGFTKGLPLLDAILQGLPPNPGLHIGAVEVPGSGPQWLFSLRYFLRAPTIDRRARFTRDAHGTIRLRCLTPLSEASAGQHYLQIVWSAHADPNELSLSSRHPREFPIGASVGVVPAISPVMYTVGASYKLHPMLELVAAAGVRKGRRAAFVFGFAVDVPNVLSAVSGTAPKASTSGSK